MAITACTDWLRSLNVVCTAGFAAVTRAVVDRRMNLLNLRKATTHISLQEHWQHGCLMSMPWCYALPSTASPDDCSQMWHEAASSAHLPDSDVLAVAAPPASSTSPPPSMDIVLAIPLEDVRCIAGAAGASSDSGAETGAAGATGDLRRLLALMLKEATPLFLGFPAGLLAASRLACRSTFIVRRDLAHPGS